MNPFAMVCADDESAFGKRLHFSVDSPGDFNSLFDAEEGGPMKSSLCGVAVAALFVSACAHSYPDLATFKPAPPGEELSTILQEAEKLQGEYSTGYKETARWQDLSQLPIIGAATVAAFVLLNDHKNAAKTASKIGIGVLGYSATRDQLRATGLPEVYIAGHGALTCILAEGSLFHGASAVARHTALKDQLQEIANKLSLTNQLRSKEPADAAAHADALKAARAVADQGIAGARTAETAALKQEGSFLDAAPTFRNSVSAVSVRVASKGRARPTVDFGALRDKMAPPAVPTKGGDGTLEASGTRALNNPQITANKLIEELMYQTSVLVDATGRLSASAPDYAASLVRVGKCPEQVPAP